MENNKPRIVKDYEKLDEEIQEQIKLVYPYGFHRNLVTYMDKDQRKRTALPFETDEVYYLVRMSTVEAKIIIAEDDDYDDDGVLKDTVKEGYEDKYADVEYLASDDVEPEIDL